LFGKNAGQGVCAPRRDRDGDDLSQQAHGTVEVHGLQIGALAADLAGIAADALDQDRQGLADLGEVEGLALTVEQGVQGERRSALTSSST
jgi:hypothetical protein